MDTPLVAIRMPCYNIWFKRGFSAVVLIGSIISAMHESYSMLQLDACASLSAGSEASQHNQGTHKAQFGLANMGAVQECP